VSSSKSERVTKKEDDKIQIQIYSHFGEVDRNLPGAENAVEYVYTVSNKSRAYDICWIPFTLRSTSDPTTTHFRVSADNEYSVKYYCRIFGRQRQNRQI
jgi:hypothetical protein